MKVFPVDQDVNPLVWWSSHKQDYPLLSLYVRANFSFQATSVASEQIYNKDKLVYDDKRKCIKVERGAGLVIAQDYLKSRINREEYRLCPDCPQPQNSEGGAKYKISCEKHSKAVH